MQSSLFVEYCCKVCIWFVVLNMVASDSLPDEIVQTNDTRLEKQLKILSNVTAFLNDVQEKLKESRHLLKRIESEVLSTTERTISEKTFWTTAPSTFKTLERSVDSSATVMDRNSWQPYDNQFNSLFGFHLRRKQCEYEIRTNSTSSLNEISSRLEASMENTTNIKTTQSSKRSSKFFSFSVKLLCGVIAAKKPQDLPPVLKYTAHILTSMQSNNLLEWLGEPFLSAVFKVAHWCADGPILALQDYTRRLAVTLTDRQKRLSVNINSIIDNVDAVILAEEVEKMYQAISELRNFPDNTTKTGYQVCLGLLDAFRKPFNRLATTDQHLTIVDAVNKLIGSSYPGLYSQQRESPRRESSSKRNSKLKKSRSNRKWSRFNHQGTGGGNCSNNTTRPHRRAMLQRQWETLRLRKVVTLPTAEETRVKEEIWKENAEKGEIDDDELVTIGMYSKVVRRKTLPTDFKSLLPLTKEGLPIKGHRFTVVHEAPSKVTTDRDNVVNSKEIVTDTEPNILMNARKQKRFYIINSDSKVDPTESTVDLKECVTEEPKYKIFDRKTIGIDFRRTISNENGTLGNSTKHGDTTDNFTSKEKVFKNLFGVYNGDQLSSPDIATSGLKSSTGISITTGAEPTLPRAQEESNVSNKLDSVSYSDEEEILTMKLREHV